MVARHLRGRADLDGDRERRPRRDASDKLGEPGGLAQQRRAEAAPRRLVDRAAAVQVDPVSA